MLARHLIEVVNRKRALVLHLGVVEEEALDPEAGRRRARPFLELVDDAGNAHELDLVRIADDDVVQQDRAGGVIVGVDAARHDRHLLGINNLRVPSGE